MALGLGAAGASALISTACAQLIGANFDETFGAGGSASASSGAGGAGGGSGSTSSGSSSSGTGSSSSGSSSSGSASSSAATGSGGGCSGTGCAPMPQPVAEMQDFPWGLAVDDTSVYWANAGPSAAGGVPLADGAIRRVDRVTGFTSTLVSGLSAPDQLVSDGTYLYWTSTLPSPSGAVYRCLISSCVAEVMSKGDGDPAGIAIDATYLYWADSQDGKVRKRPRDQPESTGIPSTTLAGVYDQPDLIVVGTSKVFFGEYSNTGHLWGVMPDWTPQPASVVPGPAVGLAIRGGDVCYTTFTTNGSVLCLDQTTFEPASAPTKQQTSPAGLASDGTSLYWANAEGPGGGQILRWTSPATPPLVLASNQTNPNGVVVAGSWVYWTNHAAGGAGGSVMRIPKD